MKKSIWKKGGRTKKDKLKSTNLYPYHEKGKFPPKSIQIMSIETAKYSPICVRINYQLSQATSEAAINH